MQYVFDHFVICFKKSRSGNHPEGSCRRGVICLALMVFLSSLIFPAYGGKPASTKSTTVKFATTPGTYYQLQGTDDPQSDNWDSLGNVFLADKKQTIISIDEYTAYTDFRLLILTLNKTSDPHPPTSTPPTPPDYTP